MIFDFRPLPVATPDTFTPYIEIGGGGGEQTDRALPAHEDPLQYMTIRKSGLIDTVNSSTSTRDNTQ